MNNASLKIDRKRVRELVEDLRRGKLLIPEFQRDYVWRPSRAAKLLDSLFRQFPVGSLLLWETPERVDRRSRSPKSIAGANSVSWLIDGQQRSRTLDKVWADDGGLDLRFNILDGSFSRASAAIKRDAKWIGVADIWDDDAWRGRREAIRDQFTGDWDTIEDNIARCRGILDYEVPVVVMKDHTFEDAVNAFERVNSLGVRLREDDLESARIASRHAGFVREEVAPTLERLRAQGFDRLYLSHLFRAAAAIARPVGRRVRLHELEPSRPLKKS